MPNKGKLYFDIETTGLSPANSHLTVIGCAYLEGDAPVVRQFICERPTDERKILADFLSFAAGFDTLVHFNGRTFDIPYLRKKTGFYRLEDTLADLHERDLYRLAGKYTKFFSMASFKQKDYEKVFCFPRTDTLSGYDCTEAYRDYLRTGNEEQLDKLLLHNKEDLLGMVHIEKHLEGFLALGEGRIRIADIRILEDEPSSPLVIDFAPEKPFHIVLDPVSAKKNPYGIRLQFKNNTGTLTIPACEAELKFYFKDYKDYYYLPVEGRAVHKSVGQFVDARYREKATKETAYEPLQAVFYPQYGEIIHPEFRYEPGDKISFFRASDIKTEEEVIRLVTSYVNAF